MSDDPTPTITIRTDAVITVAVVAALAFLAGVVVASTIILSTIDREPDPFAGVPWCTDAIADAGGVCHGEPVPACLTEDSTDCYWDAATMGNGRGTSFVDIGGVVYPTE